jgi:micrococcal nuclease
VSCVLFAFSVAAALAVAGASASGCASGGSPCGPTSATVTKVVDGDTVDVDGDLRVRYIGVDTPETSGGQIDCYGPEAAEYNRQAVLDKQVTLEYDVECKDRYGRLLAYVYAGGKMVNLTLLERGYGKLMLIKPNVLYEAEMRAAEAAAKVAQAGLWGACQ